MSKPTVGGLFSGVGGIELAFSKAGFAISWANDMDEKAHETYKAIMKTDHYIGNKAMPVEKMLQNSYKQNLNYVDVLVGGFPCQAFSVAGYRKGFKDERGNVFFRIIDVLKHLKKTSVLPKALLLENVKNFKTHANGDTFHRVKFELEKLNYSVYTKILNTCDHTNIPQNRERTFIVCFRNEKKWRKYQFDDVDLITSSQANKALQDCPATMSFHLNFNITMINRPKLKPINYLINPNASDEFYYTKNKFPKVYALLEKEMHNENTLYQFRRVYVRENKNNLCPTLTANMGTGGHNVPLVVTYGGRPRIKKNKRYRKLTPAECFKFQGYSKVNFPNEMANCHLYKQAGNSVTVPLVKKLAHIIYRSILEIN